MEKETKKRKTGLFGGTFNPIHLGHLLGAEEIRDTFGLDEVIFIPSAIPPHKDLHEVIDVKHRLEMVRLAIASNPFFSISDIELSRPGKSYTIDTIRYFRGKNDHDPFFILGREAFVEIETWKDYQDLFTLCHFIVMTRPGFQKKPVASQLPQSLTPVFQYDIETKAWTHFSGYHLYFKEISFLDISSTRVRQLVERRESIGHWVPTEVEVYIQSQGLYQRKL